MPDPRIRPGLEPGTDPLTPSLPDAIAEEAREKKKREKVRAAWISFAGRIVAQVVGAMMTVALTLFVVQKAQQQPSQAAQPAAPDAAAASVVPAATVSPAAPAIAVLPLADYSENTSQTSFANGLTEALIAALADRDDLHVISRTSSMRYRDSHKMLPDIARELGATHVIEGSIVRERSRLRVTVQLIDAATDQHLWAASYDRRGDDMLTLQAELAAAIANGAGGVIGTR